MKKSVPVFYVPPKISDPAFILHLYEAKEALEFYQTEQGLPTETLSKEAENYLFSSHLFAYLFPEAKETIDGNDSDFMNHLVIENKELKHWLDLFFEVERREVRHPAFQNISFLMGRYLTVLKTMGAFTQQLPQITILLMTDFPLFEEQLIEEGLRNFSAMTISCFFTYRLSWKRCRFVAFDEQSSP